MIRNSNKSKSYYGDENERFVDITSPFSLRLNLAQVEELQKNKFDQLSLSSPSSLNLQSFNEKVNPAPKPSLFKFFQVLIKKTQQIRQNRKKFSFFKKVYQETIFHSEFQKNKEKSRYMINPKNIFLLIFQYIRWITIIFLLILLTFQWSFGDFNFIQENNIVIYATLFLLLDISLQFNQAIVEKGRIIYQRKVVYKKYFFDSFLEDLIFIVSMLLVVYTEYFIVILIFFIFGIFKLFNIFNKLQELFDLSKVKMEVVKLIKLLIFINLLAHFISCVWHFIGKNASDAKKNWIFQKGLEDQDTYTLYINSFYFTVTTMITVGYGDITPQNNDEMLVCVFVMFLSCGVYAYSLNVIGQIVQTINIENDQLEDTLRAVNKYCKQYNIKDELQSRLKNYLQYQFTKENNQLDNIYNVFNRLSKHLKNKIVSDVFQELIKACSILKENFSHSTLLKSSSILELLNFERDDFIINQGLTNENALYFIDSGTIQIYETRSKTNIIELKCGQFFGEYEFFTNAQAKFSYKCKTHCKVFKLPRQNFIDLLDKNDFEMFHYIKHCFEFKIPIQQYECTVCNKIGHLLHNCDLLFYRPNFTKLILRSENQKQTSRTSIIRRRQKNNSLSVLHFTQVKQDQYLRQILLSEEESQLPNEQQSQFSAIKFKKQVYKIDPIDFQLPQEESSYKRSNVLGKTRLSVSEYNQISQSQLQEQRVQKGSQPFRDTPQIHLELQFDKMKEYQQYFKNQNYESKINQYNSNYFNRYFVQPFKKKVIRTMKFIQFDD